MVYECENCGNVLLARALVCPICGEGFDKAVPSDAEVPERGRQPKSETRISLGETSQSQIKTAITPKIVILQEHLSKLRKLVKPIYRQPRKQLTPLESKNRKTIIWLVSLVSFLIFGIIQDITGGKGFEPESPSQSNSASTTPEPLDSESQKRLDAENAMDEQNSHDATLNNLPPPPKIGSACGPPAKTNPDGTISVSARRLYYDYVTDGPAANEKYQFQTLKVTGAFLAWENDGDGEVDNDGDKVYLIYLVSGNTWVDNDPQASTTHVFSISCSFDGTVPKAFTHRIIENRNKTPVIVSIICTCTCDDPTVTDPMLKLNCSSIKIVNSIH